MLHVAISDKAYRIHRRPKFLRRLWRRRYPRNIVSGAVIWEFIALADACRARGVPVAPRSRVEELLAAGTPVEAFGAAATEDDLWLLRRHPNTGSAWTAEMLEAVSNYDDYLDLGRKTWRFYLGDDEQHQRLARLFAEYDGLFVKSLRKGFAKVFESWQGFHDFIGDPARLGPDAREILVSELLDIRQIDVLTEEGPARRPDEWRHHIYRDQWVSSTHACDCDPARSDSSGREANVKAALKIAETLTKSDFPDTYVLDTCSLADGRVLPIETNNLFAAGVYSRDAVDALAERIAAHAY